MILASGSGSVQSALQLVGVLLIFLFVLVITWFVTRFIAGYQKVQTRGRNLKIIETLRLTNNKYVQIIEAGEKYLVIAVGKDEVRLLATLTAEELLAEEDAPTATGGQFQDAFREALGRVKDRLPKKQA